MRNDPKALAGIWAMLVAGLLHVPPFPGPPTPAAEPLPIACSADRPTVALGEAEPVRLRAWAAAPSAQALKYVWQATIGELKGRGAEVRWDLAGVRLALTYVATVRVESPGGGSAECELRVHVRSDPGVKGGFPPPSPGPARETGAALLAPEAAESPGYGLYSYLLLGAPPTEATRARYLKTIEAYWGLVPEISRLEAYVPRRELNVAYLPVTGVPSQSVSAQWLLDHHDFARARSLLRVLPGSNREGPYIVSALRPLGGAAGATGASGPHLFQDLSSVPPHLASSWVKEFLNQAAQERFWEARTGERLALRLRMTVGILGMGLPEVRRALDTWIAWVR